MRGTIKTRDVEGEISSLMQSSVQEVWRLVIAVVGISILLTGIALLILPGPGWLIILIGLGVLGSEFMWARRLMRRVRGRLISTERLVKREINRL